MVVVTGATGQTGSKVTGLLLDKGIKVRVVGRSEKNLGQFKNRGAQTAVGKQEDLSFLTGAFKGADSVYLLIPPKLDTPDIRKYYNDLGSVAVKALQESGVKKVVFLSSLGAELDSGTGPVIGLHDVEAMLAKLTRTDIVMLRAGYFMENTLRNIPLIKHNHINGNPVPPDAPVSMVATRDIAEKAAGLLSAPTFKGHSVVDLFGDRISYKEATRLLGEVVGIPDLSYVEFPGPDAEKSMVQMGMSENMARSFVELSASLGKGLIHPTQIDPQKPNAAMKFKQFAEEVFGPEFKNAA
jgi:uncharacterized protein YbjT (DUF2867 family)